MDEFSFKKRKTWGRSKITSYCICIWCESGERGGRRSSRFSCVTPVAEIFSLDRVAHRIPSNINYRVPLWKQPTTLTCWQGIIHEFNLGVGSHSNFVAWGRGWWSDEGAVRPCCKPPPTPYFAIYHLYVHLYEAPFLLTIFLYLT